ATDRARWLLDSRFRGNDSKESIASGDDQHLALTESGLVSHQSPRAAAEADRPPRPAQPMLEQPEIVELHHAAIAEGRQQVLGLVEEDQAAAAKAVAGETPDPLLDDDG